SVLFTSLLRRHPLSTLFPYTTLFRSHIHHVICNSCRACHGKDKIPLEPHGRYHSCSVLYRLSCLYHYERVVVVRFLEVDCFKNFDDTICQLIISFKKLNKPDMRKNQISCFSENI